jgi:hypothetical protein
LEQIYGPITNQFLSGDLTNHSKALYSLQIDVRLRPYPNLEERNVLCLSLVAVPELAVLELAVLELAVPELAARVVVVEAAMAETVRDTDDDETAATATALVYVIVLAAALIDSIAPAWQQVVVQVSSTEMGTAMAVDWQ